jgi:hypothetical protein
MVEGTLEDNSRRGAPLLPAKVMSLVVEWAQDHQEELLANWNSISETGEYRKINPLV